MKRSEVKTTKFSDFPEFWHTQSSCKVNFFHVEFWHENFLMGLKNDFDFSRTEKFTENFPYKNFKWGFFFNWAERTYKGFPLYNLPRNSFIFEVGHIYKGFPL